MAGRGGTRWEYMVRDHLKARGFEVIRAAGSKGASDLFCWNVDTGDVLLVQCKKESKRKGYKDDVVRLSGLRVFPWWKRQLWVKTKQMVTVYSVFNGRADVDRVMTLKELRA